MTEYICLNCNKKMAQDDIKDRIRCPYCGYRIISKARPSAVVKVPAK